VSKRDRSSALKRKESVRDEVEVKSDSKTLLSFSFKDIDETQPPKNPQTLDVWHEKDLLKALFRRIKEVSQLSRDEALKQQQIKIYGDFPVKSVTDFFHPEHVPKTVYWGVLKRVGGQTGTVAGYLVDNVFHVVFLDMNHRFWITELKNT
jgi:hypothetical protein